MKVLFSLVFFCMLMSACQTKQSDTTTLTPNPSEKQILKDIPTSENSLSTFFNEAEIKTISEIKKQFEFGLSGGKDITNIARLYEGHALRMRLDLFNKFPYTLNFPYNGKFDLSQIENLSLEQLRFINTNCGFQKEEGIKITHICLSSPSNYTTFLGAIGEKNSLVKSLLTDYEANKIITPTAKQMIVLNSAELDFTKIEHQIIYLFFHVFVNEERLAFEKVKS